MDPWVLIVSLSTHIVVGQCISVQVVFSIPEKACNIIFNSGVAIPQHLVYMEWYTPFSNPFNRNHLLYKVSPLRDDDAPSPRSMRCKRLEAEGSVRLLYLWCDVQLPNWADSVTQG